MLPNDGALKFFLETIWTTARVLLLLGVLQMFLNLFLPSIYIEDCGDPLLATTIRGIQNKTIYSWCWITVNCGTLLCLALYAVRMLNKELVRKKESESAYWSVAHHVDHNTPAVLRLAHAGVSKNSSAGIPNPMPSDGGI